MTRYNVDWTSLHSEPDEDTLTYREAMDRPGPLDQQPVSSLGNAFMWGLSPDARSRDWMADAACRGMDASLFFPDDSDLATRHQAAQVCDGCPVATECDDYANGIQDGITVTAKESDGVWAGRLRSRNVQTGKRGARPAVGVCTECGELFQMVRSQGGGRVPKACSTKCLKERERRRQRERYARKRAAS